MNLYKVDIEPGYFQKVGDNLFQANLFGTNTDVIFINPTIYSKNTGQITTRAAQQAAMITVSTNLQVPAADYADSVWASAGWNLNNIDSEFDTFAQSNLVNCGDPDMNWYIIRKTIGGTAYTVIFTFPGDAASIKLITGYESIASRSTLTQQIFSSEDDSYRELADFPFAFNFFGTDYANSIYVGSNSYITFGFASSVYSGLSASNPGRAIHFGSADNSWQQVWWGQISIGNKPAFRVIYEGTASTGGSVGSPNIVYQLTFFENQRMNVTFAQHARTGGLRGISNGSTLTNTYDIFENTSYAFQSDALGNNWTIQQGKYWG